jgi:hypothetical protein
MTGITHPKISSVEHAPFTAGCEQTVHHPRFVSCSRCGRIVSNSGESGKEENGDEDNSE